MALKRKKQLQAGRCYFCKTEKTLFTAHGGWVRGGGKRCCDNCIGALREEDRKIMRSEKQDMSLGEEKAYREYGI